MEQAIVYDLLNQQFLHALKELAARPADEDQQMAADIVGLLTKNPQAIHAIDSDYKEATIMACWSPQLTNQSHCTNPS
ncbi:MULTISPECIES: hypothetical protein [Shouchella]|uniref:Uncharacterized protein n=3 Tax=Bacillaceae TaxID=186817 RepID=A0A060M769_9BACI|nr:MULTISPECIES: hypothetical protein [Bacillaceae]RQW18581.1 hypothetical protein EH196_16525 [Bacillus sp. C1-1]AIC95929.1 hypothetical protein BleG1_3382 [Shouchella lehensis G1]KQL56568.1 hypothetical protein AN965_12660 [Alkalicoccobacillus plakortidis]MBG9784887.1 hypothetical protein [Shouchella lehensis]TES46301.1 hypothetical protein E2L03_16485 [Shouchella lehensis]